ncbi:MAG TPA: phosphoribosylglycinamide formyltransferase [Gammaproteobacteria bacterium]|nr:phosphoribosylglycinamide formyltransferase [Gammaproteobacteria bacterium]
MKSSLPRVVVLGSGTGTNFEALAEKAGDDYEIVAVGSDRRDAPILERARRRRIPTFSCTVTDFPESARHDSQLASALGARRPEWVALAGYMRILGPDTLAACAGRILNVHPALLPLFPGTDTHRRALAAGASEHGATVHFVTARLDAGPAILQGRTAVRERDDPESLRLRVQALEHRIYPLALAWCARGRVLLRQNRAWFDGRPLDEPVTILEARQCA